MVVIEEILQLPVDAQLAILHAIQDNLDNVDDEEVENDEKLSDEHIAFIEERVNNFKAEPTYTWQQVKEELKAQRSMKYTK